MKTGLAWLFVGIVLLGLGSTARRFARLATVTGHVAVGFAFGYWSARINDAAPVFPRRRR